MAGFERIYTQPESTANFVNKPSPQPPHFGELEFLAEMATRFWRPQDLHLVCKSTTRIRWEPHSPIVLLAILPCVSTEFHDVVAAMEAFSPVRRSRIPPPTSLATAPTQPAAARQRSPPSYKISLASSVLLMAKRPYRVPHVVQAHQTRSNPSLPLGSRFALKIAMFGLTARAMPTTQSMFALSIARPR